MNTDWYLGIENKGDEKMHEKAQKIKPNTVWPRPLSWNNFWESFGPEQIRVGLDCSQQRFVFPIINAFLTESHPEANGANVKLAAFQLQSLSSELENRTLAGRASSRPQGGSKHKRVESMRSPDSVGSDFWPRQICLISPCRIQKINSI